MYAACRQKRTFGNLVFAVFGINVLYFGIIFVYFWTSSDLVLAKAAEIDAMLAPPASKAAEIDEWNYIGHLMR